MRHGLLGAACTTQDLANTKSRARRMRQPYVVQVVDIAHLDGLLRTNSSTPAETGGSQTDSLAYVYSPVDRVAASEQRECPCRQRKISSNGSELTGAGASSSTGSLAHIQDRHEIDNSISDNIGIGPRTPLRRKAKAPWA